MQKRETRLSTSFLTKAMTGYVVVILILGGGVLLAARRLDETAIATVATLHAAEDEITQAEHLRWNGELMVSAGRGYLVSGDAGFLQKLRSVEHHFDDEVKALTAGTVDRVDAALLSNVERSAAAYRHVQQRILSTRTKADSAGEVANRFETELQPEREELSQSLDRFVDHKEAIIRNTYDRAERDRTRLSIWTQSLLGLVILLSLGIAWHFARLLARSFRTEQEAVKAAHSAVAARDEVMGVVAHDLRNPLGAIKMKAALLRAKANSDTTSSQAASIENVAMRMEYLIRTMLDVTTLEAGRFSVSEAPCAIADLLRQSVELFGALANSKQIQLEMVADEPGVVIHADRERVLQVLSNLLGNALKFTPQGGKVTLSVVRTGDVVRFAVSDSGSGIAPSDLPHLFERFWKREKRGEQGTGLGLFIAHAIIEAHGHRIWVESERGRGATFYFTLSVASAEAALDGAPPPESARRPVSGQRARGA